MNPTDRLPPPPVNKILLWHQGALGDLLLAGPALAAIQTHYASASLVAAGQPSRWRLLAKTLSLITIWDAGGAMWSALFQDQGPLPPTLEAHLSGIDLALIFTPRPRPGFLSRLSAGGVRQAFWVPSFPENGCEPVSVIQGRRLKELGLEVDLKPFRLHLADSKLTDLGFAADDRLLVLGPGSGQPAKNWPLSHYYEVARALAWEAGLKVVWLAGPAEEALLPYIHGLAAAQGQEVWARRPLDQVALLLSHATVYLGGDSGLTHLAAAAGARQVVALFGPTDPRVWAPLGENVTVLTPPSAAGEKSSLDKLTVAKVLRELKRHL